MLQLLIFRFLLAKLQLKHTLAQKLPRKIEEALDSLPVDIREAYDKFFQDEDDELMYEVLSWIFYARRPMLMDELREALAVGRGDSELRADSLPSPDFLIEECRSLVTFDEDRGSVDFSHATVREYLETQKIAYLLKPEDLTEVLLTYLSFDVLKLPVHHDYELERRLDSYKLSRYAAKWWPGYTRGQGERNPEVQRLILKIFGSPDHIDSMLQIAAARIEHPTAITLLHFAAAHDLKLICEWLCGGFGHAGRRDAGVFDRKLSLGARKTGQFGTVHSRNGFDETPLHLAARNGNVEILNLLVASGADVNVASSKSEYVAPLHLAVLEGHDECVNTLIKYGADLECLSRYWRETPLLLASYLGRVATVGSLLDAKANVHASVASFDETGIMWALHSPNPASVIRLLLSAGAEINQVDREGRTAIHYALELLPVRHCKDVLALLVEGGADVNVACMVTGDTPLHLAAKLDIAVNRHLSTIRDENLQRDRFASKLENAEQGMIVVDPVSERELFDIVRLLLQAHARPSAWNLDGETPLHCSVKARNASVSYLLLSFMGGQVDFTMDSIGDQDFLDIISRDVLREASY